MSCRTQRRRSNRFRETASLFVVLSVVLVAPIGAQKTAKPTSPKYDLQTETKMKATIEEVKLPPKGSEKEIAHLMVKAGADTLNVYLCPKSFMDDMGMDFGKGDEISLTGSKVKDGDVELILAREVVKGNDSFVLRDAKGDPVWNWR
jgi:hypothetical protein